MASKKRTRALPPRTRPQRLPAEHREWASGRSGVHKVGQRGHAGRQGEHLIARGRDDHGMFPLGREAAVLGLDGPAVTHFADFAAAGFFRILQPRRWGGYELEPNVFYDVQKIIADYYAGERFINVLPVDLATTTEGGFYNVEANNDTNRVDIAVFGNDERMLVVARLDNLGKGASGAAVQAMNVHLGVEETLGLI